MAPQKKSPSTKNNSSAATSGKAMKATRGVKSPSLPSANLNKAMKTASRTKTSPITAGSKASSSSASKASVTSASKFDLNKFISEKFENIDDTSLNQAIAGTKKSTLGDLIAFNTTLAHSYYKICDQDSLEAVTYALQSEGTIKDQVMSPSVAEAYSQLSQFHDLLLLEDIQNFVCSVTQDRKPYSYMIYDSYMIEAAHTLCSPAQVALMTSILGLAMKLTGSGLSRLQISMPGGKIRGKDRSEVVAYLSLMRNVADTIAESNIANPSGQSQAIQKMHADLVKIMNNY